MKVFVCWFVKLTGYLPQLVIFRNKYDYINKKAQSRRIKGPAVLISNHTSVYDFVCCMFTFFSRNLRGLVGEVMFEKNWFMSWLLSSLGAIRIDRDDFDFSFVKKCQSLLDKGQVVEVFPEARLPLPGEKRPLPFKPSAAYIALLSGAKVIPMYTSGDYFSFKRNRVLIGEPIDPADIIDPCLSEKENIERINLAMRQAILDLEDEFKKRLKK